MSLIIVKSTRLEKLYHLFVVRSKISKRACRNEIFPVINHGINM